MDAAQVELIEKIEIEVGEIADSIEPCRHVRVAKAGMLRRNDVEFFGEARHGGKPNADAAAAMKKDEGGAGPSMRQSRMVRVEIEWAAIVPALSHSLRNCAGGWYPSNIGDIYTNLRAERLRRHATHRGAGCGPDAPRGRLRSEERRVGKEWRRRRIA